MNNLLKAVLSVLFITLSSGLAFGQVPQLINFQAQIDEISSGTVSVTFSIYDSPSGGTELWSETHPALSVNTGRIQALLGSEETLDPNIFESDGDRYIQISINGEVLTPRSQITSVVYALHAATADRLTSTSNQENLVLGPDGSLEVTNASNQTVSVVGTNGQDGLVAIRDQSALFDAVALTARENGLGGRFLLSGNEVFPAIEMFADSDTDGGRMVFREPQGSDAAVSSMVLTANDGAGRIVLLDNNNVVIALKGDTRDIITSGSIGVGYTGNINDAEVNSLYNLDVVGDARVTGNLSKGGGSFTIDHPLDPLNKNLSHSFVESPDMMNVYNGNVELNQEGEAWVELPEWFEALNMEFRYQLTCIGGYAPIYIAEKIQDNRFKIAGGSQGLEVSWQVTGIRNDPYANHNRIKVEEEKSSKDKGRYLHPDAYESDN